jgi:predicted nucleic acid-binding protein
VQYAFAIAPYGVTVPSYGLPKAMVFEQVEQFRKCFEVADDTPIVTEQLIKLLDDFKVGGKQVHDANIVATMLAYDIPYLLTHNIKDFQRFENIIRIESIDCTV